MDSQVTSDFLYLVSCGIEGISPDHMRVSQMKLEKIYFLSRWQSLTALTCMALESLWKESEKGKDILESQNGVWKKWQEDKNKAIRKNLLMNTERQHLCAFLEQQGIWYLPLKGSLLQYLYPVFGMRQMADNDLLFDMKARQQVYDWFTAHGYSVKSYGISNHDVYQKEPIYNFEMHTELFGESLDNNWREYYTNIKDRLLLNEGSSFGYHFSDEDFYIYMIVHEYKHYMHSGTGLRFLLDIYVYNREKGSQMNWEYIRTELKKLGLFLFEKEMRFLAKKVFFSYANKKELSLNPQEQKLLEEFFLSATYGTIQQSAKKGLRKLSGEKGKISIRIKILYLKNRLFPDASFMRRWCQAFAPALLKYPWMLPFAWIFRIVTNGFRGRKRYEQEFQTVRKE